jgi:hypothetical protein
MKAFEVFLNGVKLCTAGVHDHGVLSTIVTWVGRADGRAQPNAGFHCCVGGLDSSTGRHMRWARPTIDVGDVITIRIVNTEVIDPESPPDRITGLNWGQG